MRCPLQFLFKFQYQAQFDATGAENELCSVFIGRSHGPDPGRSATRFWPGAGSVRTRCRPRWPAPGGRNFTPWFMLEWERIWEDHRHARACNPLHPGTVTVR